MLLLKRMWDARAAAADELELCVAPQIRSHDFWRYVNLYALMYVSLRIIA